MSAVKEELSKNLSKELDISVEVNDIEIPSKQHGDYSYPMMKAAAKLNESPMDLGKRVVERINSDLIAEVNLVEPGYVNIVVDKEKHAEIVFEELNSDKMGVKSRDGKVLVEFSSPNLAKPMHIGHVRNNCLGDSLQRIMRFVGFDVISENYIGDWGTKHGQVIYAYKKWGSKDKFDEAPMEHMYDLYVKLNQEGSEEDHEKAKEWSRKIEEGDKEAKRIWKMFREATINYNEEEYNRMGIEFDRFTGESLVAEEAEKLIEEGLDKNIFESDDDGSVYIEFEDEDLPSTILKREDGSTLYLSRDIANIKKREREGFDLNMYVVASEQELHFKQLFKIAEMFDINNLRNEHISYGMLRLEEGSISSSKGNIISLSDLLDKAVQKAEQIEGKDVNNSEAVGIGAIKYANLSVSRSKDINFEWNDVLTFEGDSGPYLQYSNTRAKSILNKSDLKAEISGNFTDNEHQLLKKLSLFPDIVEESADNREPAKIANYLLEVCEEFNSFYHSSKVIGSKEKTEKRRLAILDLFVDVTDQGLDLLGIKPLEEM